MVGSGRFHCGGAHETVALWRFGRPLVDTAVDTAVAAGTGVVGSLACG